MHKSLFTLAARATAGFLIALAAWLWLSVPYTRLLAGMSESMIRLSEWPSVTSITPRGTLMVVARADFPPPRSSNQLAVESTDITFNFVLLMTLFAASAGTLSDRNVFGFAAASVGLVVVHVVAVIAFVKFDYALNHGAWSEAHYGVVARKFWGAAPYFYSLVGAYALAFALWWIFRPHSLPAAQRARRSGTRRV